MKLNNFFEVTNEYLHVSLFYGDNAISGTVGTLARTLNSSVLEAEIELISLDEDGFVIRVADC